MKDEFIKYYIGINKLFTDRVYVVIEVPNNDYKSHDAWIRSIDEAVDELVEQGRLIRKKTPYTKEFGSVPYNEQYWCQYHKNGVATEVNIHKRPKRNRRAKRQGYIKFDFCPFKLRDDNRKAFVYLVKRIFRYCNFNVCVHAWITKIEITTDMLDITPNDFHITVNRKRHSCVIGEYKALETVYVGSKHSRCVVKYYDKLKQIKKRYPRAKLPKRPVTRLEITLSKQHIPLSELEFLNNPFDRITFYKSKLKVKDFDLRLCRMANGYFIKQRGLQTALTEARKYGHDYRKELSKYEIDIIDTDSLWEQWPKAISFLKLFKNL
tara:strand:+ start:2432 stop:3397 length:966 start_codon:yes stop_codon:yes gene_type:complete